MCRCHFCRRTEPAGCTKLQNRKDNPLSSCWGHTNNVNFGSESWSLELVDSAFGAAFLDKCAARASFSAAQEIFHRMSTLGGFTLPHPSRSAAAAERDLIAFFLVVSTNLLILEQRKTDRRSPRHHKNPSRRADFMSCGSRMASRLVGHISVVQHEEAVWIGWFLPGLKLVSMLKVISGEKDRSSLPAWFHWLSSLRTKHAELFHDKWLVRMKMQLSSPGKFPRNLQTCFTVAAAGRAELDVPQTTRGHRTAVQPIMCAAASRLVQSLRSDCRQTNSHLRPNVEMSVANA